MSTENRGLSAGASHLTTPVESYYHTISGINVCGMATGTVNNCGNYITLSESNLHVPIRLRSSNSVPLVSQNTESAAQYLLTKQYQSHAYERMQPTA